jgi:hypothetical protein
VLYFIQSDRHVQPGNETVGIAPGSRQNAGIIEGELLTVLPRQFRRLHQGAFPGLSGAVDQNGRRVCQSIEKPVDNLATKHNALIHQSLDDNQPSTG